METRHVLVAGTVQGVGYRAACRRAAAVEAVDVQTPGAPPSGLTDRFEVR